MSSINSQPSTRRAFTHIALTASVFIAGLLASTANAGDIVPASMDAYKQASMAKKPIIMHIHASWCPACAKQNPALEALMKEPEFKDVVVFKIDFDTDKALVEQLGVKSQSTLIAAKGPVEIDRMVGISDQEQIRQFIRKAL